MILQIFLLAVLLLAVPTAVGSLVPGLGTAERKGRIDFPFQWICGQMILWAGFQIICVPLVLAEIDFWYFVTAYSVYIVFMLLAAFTAAFLRKRRSPVRLRLTEAPGAKRDRMALLLWGCVAMLLLIQLALAVILAYEEGDDAFYVAVSVITENADTMYRKLPYTGGATGLDSRHGLAPFPIWVAYLARLTGMHPAVMAQVALPPVLIVMSYTVYYLLARRLFREERKIALFLLVTEILVVFGGYSLQSAENFLLVRTAQGKAVLANIVIPFLLLIFLRILEDLQRNKRTGAGCWLPVALTMISACLCSTEGAFLVCVLLGCAGICTLASYRRYKLILPMAGCCAVPVCVALLYLLL